MSTREAAILAHDYLNGEATREQLIQRMLAMPRLEGKCGPRRLISKKLILRRLEATIGEHICALWQECGTTCCTPNFQKETLQFRALADPLQRALTDDNSSRGVVQDVLGRIARRQDAELSNLVVAQKQEIAGLKAKADGASPSRPPATHEEMLHDHCKTAIANGLIDSSTPATQALLRVLRHCHPIATTGYEYSAAHQSIPREKPLTAAREKSDPLLFGTLSVKAAANVSETGTASDSVLKVGAVPTEATAKTASHTPSIRPEEWVRRQRLKNASESRSIILQRIAEAPHPSDRQGLARFLPDDAPLSKLTSPDPGEGQRKKPKAGATPSEYKPSVFTPWMLPASYTPLFEKSENSMMVIGKTGNIEACH